MIEWIAIETSGIGFSRNSIRPGSTNTAAFMASAWLKPSFSRVDRTPATPCSFAVSSHIGNKPVEVGNGFPTRLAPA
jgi:hypothetical protein